MNLVQKINLFLNETNEVINNEFYKNIYYPIKDEMDKLVDSTSIREDIMPIIDKLLDEKKIISGLRAKLVKLLMETIPKDELTKFNPYLDEAIEEAIKNYTTENEEFDPYKYDLLVGKDSSYAIAFNLYPEQMEAKKYHLQFIELDVARAKKYEESGENFKAAEFYLKAFSYNYKNRTINPVLLNKSDDKRKLRIDSKQGIDYAEKATTLFLKYGADNGDNQELFSKGVYKALEYSLCIAVEVNLQNKLAVFELIEKFIEKDHEYKKESLVKLLVDKVKSGYDHTKHLPYLDKAIAYHISKDDDIVEYVYKIALIIAKGPNKEKYHRGLVNHYIKKAENYSSLGRPSEASAFYGDALDICNQYPGYKQEKDELYKKMLECQKESVKLMVPIEFEYTTKVSDCFANVENLTDALWLYADLNIESKFLEDSSNLYKDIPIKIVDKEGKVKRHGQSEDHQIQYQSICSYIYLDTIRNKFINQLTKEFWLDFIKNCNFVPDDRKDLVSHALYLGGIGDMVSFAHIMLPQIENCFREGLKDKGQTTSTIDKRNQTQKADGLEKCLANEKLQEILNKDIIDILQKLLIEIGFRHELAHGLLESSQIQHYANLLYWLVIKVLKETQNQ